MKELGDKDMNLENLGNVFAFDIPENLDEPLKMPMRWTDPQKVNLQG